jgi:formate hydrogenlyase transcriptional activator
MNWILFITTFDKCVCGISRPGCIMIRIMDINEFFREATKTICGDLEIDKALSSSLEFLRKNMPVNRVWLQFYDEGLHAMHIVAIATPDEGKTVDWLAPLSSEAQRNLAQLAEEFSKEEPGFVWLFRDDSMDKKLFREVMNFLGADATSLIVLPLGLRYNHLIGGGALILTTEGKTMFSRQDADLISIIREPFAIAMSNTLKHREALELRDLLADDNRYLHGELRRLTGDEIIGMNFGLKEVMDKVSHVAVLDSPVLLLGETGTGKDVIANAIHYSSSRQNGPFIKVNCGAIPDTLIDSELFGHEKGAFTGAVSQKRGFFERADKGTIFLDEIGELPLPAQVRFLRVLQDKKIERVGGTKTLQLDIRVIAATNKDLKEMVANELFRQDLWFRLNVFPIQIPPLRQRKTDIPALVHYLITLKVKELKLPAIPEIAQGAIDSLMQYDWPGNVRELQNMVERALILNPNGPVVFDDPCGGGSTADTGGMGQLGEIIKLDDVIAESIRRALEMTDGRIHGKGGAAELLGVNPSTLRSRMQKLGLDN